jgi:rhamnogalacturonan endolyase
MSWMESQNLTGWVAKSSRGQVIGAGLSGMNPAYPYTVAFSNAVAQYWTTADPATGAFVSPDMKPGTYVMTVYKGEYAVLSESVGVVDGQQTRLTSRSAANDPGNAAALWRIGDWDGTPNEFVNASRLRNMHPSDVRHSPWVLPAYVVGVSTPATGFSPYQWAAVNNKVVIKFNLTSAQIAPLTVRAGVTVAQFGGRPKAQVNAWVSSNPSASSQPDSRGITLGSFRGNNTMFTYNVPASALVVGENTLTLAVISGSSGEAYLSPGYAYDAVDLIRTP